MKPASSNRYGRLGSMRYLKYAYAMEYRCNSFFLKLHTCAFVKERVTVSNFNSFETYLNRFFKQNPMTTFCVRGSNFPFYESSPKISIFQIIHPWRNSYITSYEFRQAVCDAEALRKAQRSNRSSGADRTALSRRCRKTWRMPLDTDVGCVNEFFLVVGRNWNSVKFIIKT